ncbi:hypothetical protein Hanom_Chr10g00960721 [Helianthus anomalus]
MASRHHRWCMIVNVMKFEHILSTVKQHIHRYMYLHAIACFKHINKKTKIISNYDCIQ